MVSQKTKERLLEYARTHKNKWVSDAAIDLRIDLRKAVEAAKELMAEGQLA